MISENLVLFLAALVVVPITFIVIRLYDKIVDKRNVVKQVHYFILEDKATRAYLHLKNSERRNDLKFLNVKMKKYYDRWLGYVYRIEVKYSPIEHGSRIDVFSDLI